MDCQQRQKRIRQLVKKANRQRKIQHKKIDLLCNDMIEAQRDFIRRLDSISFSAHFYEMILDARDISSLFYTAGKLIAEQMPGTNVAFFLRKNTDFELHMLEDDEPITLDKHRLENCFTRELVNDICQANKVCRLEDMPAMGLEEALMPLSKISAVTIPIGQNGISEGFILLYRSCEQKLTENEINHILTTTSGLYKAVCRCSVPSHIDC